MKQFESTTHASTMRRSQRARLKTLGERRGSDGAPQDAAARPRPLGLGAMVFGFRTRSGHGRGGLLRTHPGDDAEADLVDHVRDVVEHGHDFRADRIGEDVRGGLKRILDLLISLTR